jgi:DNA topoisomerase-2
MWVGSHALEESHIDCLVDGRLVQTTAAIHKSALQPHQEATGNMLDSMARHDNKVVNKFHFTYDKDTGRTSIFNNGPSIEVVKMKTPDGKMEWVPEVLCAHLLSSSNHDKSTGWRRISLGAHGIGLKSIASLSVWMKIECVDMVRKLYYSQVFKEGKTIIEDPIIEKMGRKCSVSPEIAKGGTRISFILDMAGVYKDTPANHAELMGKVFEARAYQLSGYVKTIAKKCEVLYNGAAIEVDGAKGLAKMYFGDTFEIVKLDHPEWGLSVAFGEPPKDRAARCISIINGGIIYEGVHFDYVINRLYADLGKRVEKLLKNVRKRGFKAVIKDGLDILIVGNIPDLVFDSQIKNRLSMDGAASYMGKYVWPKTYAGKVWKLLESRLVIMYLIGAKKTTMKRKLQDPKKYIPAYKLGHDANLLIFEGDSAKSAAVVAMADPKISFSRRNHGIYLMGNPPNGRKEEKVTETSAGDFRKYSPKFDNNIKWSDFVVAMNLDRNKTYDTIAEIETLNYQKITLVVDKDYHGMGQIGPLVLSNLLLFWPALLDIHGFLGFMDTPVIRAFPNDRRIKVKEFSSVGQFDVWRNEIFPGGVLKGWKAKWFKGMATHSERECGHMFGRFNKLRVLIDDPDGRGIEILEMYFGKSTDIRKQLLATPPDPLPEVGPRMSVVELVNHFVKANQRYNIVCKLDNMFDGLILSHRTIIWGLLLYMKVHGNAPIKVYQLAGFIAQRVGYHHGDASLYAAIIWLTQAFVGAREIPMGLPLSLFGTRLSNDTIQARYVDTQANPIIRLIFRPEDSPLLTLTIVDGEESIPRNLMPVVPFSMFMTRSTAATGWATFKVARDYDEVIANVERMMEFKMPLPMKPWTPHWNGRVEIIGGVEWLIGSVERDGDNVRITELPFRTYNDSYIHGNSSATSLGLYGLDLIEHKTIIDSSTKRQIDITFKLVPGGAAVIEEKYSDHPKMSALEKYLKLGTHATARLNVIDNSEIVRPHVTYESLMVPWFAARYKMYGERFRYEDVVNRWKIKLLREKLRYIRLRTSLELEGVGRARQTEQLILWRFKKMNVVRINNPGADVAKMVEVVYGVGSTYSYLLMNHDDMSAESVAAMNAKIAALLAETAERRKFGAVFKKWRAEIAEVSEHVHRAMVSGWDGDGGYKY